jgi:hypothetical protein
VMRHAAAFNATEHRSYSFWVRHNLWDFLFGAGVCQAIVFVVAVAGGIRATRSWRAWLTSPIGQVTAGLILMVVGLDIAGLNRGEAVRLWIFLACLFQVPVAWACARLESRVALALVIAASVLQAALGTAMIGFLVI